MQSQTQTQMKKRKRFFGFENSLRIRVNIVKNVRKVAWWVKKEAMTMLVGRTCSHGWVGKGSQSDWKYKNKTTC